MQDKINDFLCLLSRKNKIQICYILANSKYTLSEIVELIEKKFGETKNRETIYRALDNMIKSGLLQKEYDITEKTIKYSLKIRGVKLDFIEEELDFYLK